MESKRLCDKTTLDIMKENGLITDKINRPILSNITDNYWTKRKIRTTLEIIAKALSSSLGIYGSTTIFQKEDGPMCSKDGLDICSHINFNDQLSNMVLNFVHSIAVNIATHSGDGTSSSIIVSNALYQAITDFENNPEYSRVPPQSIVDILEEISSIVSNKIKVLAKPVDNTLEDIKNVAGIAMNNSPEVGQLICDIYKNIGKDGIISYDTDIMTDEDYVEYKNGISWKRGVIDPLYISEEKAITGKIVYNKPYIFLCRSPLNYDDHAELFKTLLENIFMNSKGQVYPDVSAVFVLHNVDQNLRTMLRNNRSMNFQSVYGTPSKMHYTVVDIDQVVDKSVNKLTDLGLLTGCTVIDYDSANRSKEDIRAKATEIAASVIGQIQGQDKYVGIKYLGTALKAEITDTSTSIICDDKLLNQKDIEAKNKVISDLQAAIEEISNRVDKSATNTIMINDMKARIAGLSYSSCILHVGGKTIGEQESRSRLIEDAIFASKSALKYGVCIGGNLIIPRILVRNHDEIVEKIFDKFSYLGYTKEFIGKFVDLVKDSFLESYRTVLENAKFLDDSKIDEIINKCVNEDYFYNLKLNKYEKDSETSVVNSVETDIEILRSCISLISRLGVSNQALTKTVDSSDLY